MNSENIKKVTNQAIEQLVEALNAGHSGALTRYLAAMARFRTYSFLNVLLRFPAPRPFRYPGHDERNDVVTRDRGEKQQECRWHKRMPSGTLWLSLNLAVWFLLHKEMLLTSTSCFE